MENKVINTLIPVFFPHLLEIQWHLNIAGNIRQRTWAFIGNLYIQFSCKLQCYCSLLRRSFFGVFSTIQELLVYHSKYSTIALYSVPTISIGEPLSYLHAPSMSWTISAGLIPVINSNDAWFMRMLRSTIITSKVYQVLKIEEFSYKNFLVILLYFYFIIM